MASSVRIGLAMIGAGAVVWACIYALAVVFNPKADAWMPQLSFLAAFAAVGAAILAVVVVDVVVEGMTVRNARLRQVGYVIEAQNRLAAAVETGLAELVPPRVAPDLEVIFEGQAGAWLDGSGARPWLERLIRAKLQLVAEKARGGTRVREIGLLDGRSLCVRDPFLPDSHIEIAIRVTANSYVLLKGWQGEEWRSFTVPEISVLEETQARKLGLRQ
jgi:hypothetical protein